MYDYLNSYCLFEDNMLYFSSLSSSMPSAYLKLVKQNKIFIYDVLVLLFITSAVLI